MVPTGKIHIGPCGECSCRSIKAFGVSSTRWRVSDRLHEKSVNDPSTIAPPPISMLLIESVGGLEAGKVKGYALTESGGVPLGSFPTRKAAMRAISARHRGRPEPAAAA